MDDNSFGARLAAARRAAGYNQTEGAKYINEVSCSTGRITTPSKSATRYRRTRTSACALPGTAWSRALFTGRSSGCIARKRSAPARSACSSITARGTASGSSARRGAWSLCRSTRGMPPSVWRYLPHPALDRADAFPQNAAVRHNDVARACHRRFGNKRLL